MDTTSIHKGTVTYFSPERHFGFLDSDFQEGIFFWFSPIEYKGLKKQELKGKKLKFVRGDEVLFKLKLSDKGDGKYEAYDLEFIKNDRFGQLNELIQNNNELVGFLKKIGSKYYVKDRETYLFLPLKTSQWETNIEEVYENRINHLVTYTVIDKTKDLEKIQAVLADRQFDPIYNKLLHCKENETPLIATITGKNKDGYFATIFDATLNTFIPFEKDGSIPDTFKKWDTVHVNIRSVYDTGVRLNLAN